MCAETLALIRLSKYRHLKRSYPERELELEPRTQARTQAQQETLDVPLAKPSPT